MNKTALVYSKEEARNMPPEKRPICYRVPNRIYHDAYILAGYSSGCWDPKPTGNFESEKASDAVVQFLFTVAEELERLGVTFEQLNDLAQCTPPTSSS